MKSIYFFLAIIFFTPSIITAQDKVMPKDFGFTNNVKQVDEIKYAYDANEKQYKIQEQNSYVFENGKLISNKYKTTGFIFLEGEVSYTYNKSGELISSTEKTSLGNETYNYTYNNGKLILKKNTDNKHPIETVFEYNEKGYLAKITKKVGGILSNTKVFSNYSNAQTYTLLETVYWDNKVSYTTTSKYVNGQETSIITAYTSSGSKPKETIFKYNNKGHIIEEIATTGTFYNVYNYDDRGNAIRVKYGGNSNSQFNADNKFSFSKITYTDGLSLGIAEFNEYFVKEYDKKSASYTFEKDFDTKKKIDLNFFDELNNLVEEKYYVLKTEVDKFKVKTSNGTYLTNAVNALKAPNNLDLIIYDTLMKVSAMCKNFYSSNTETEKWLTTFDLVESESNIYIVFQNNTKTYSLISNAKYLALSNYKFKPYPNTTSDYIIIEKGVDKYVIRNVNGKKDDIFYPLELLK